MTIAAVRDFAAACCARFSGAKYPAYWHGFGDLAKFIMGFSVGLLCALLFVLCATAAEADELPDILSAPHVAEFDANWGTVDPKIGISVVTYGRPIFLDFALQQIRWQTVQPHEVVRDFETAAKRTHEMRVHAGCG